MAGPFLERQLVMPYAAKLIMSLAAYSFIIRVNRQPPFYRVSQCEVHFSFVYLPQIPGKIPNLSSILHFISMARKYTCHGTRVRHLPAYFQIHQMNA